METEDKNKTSIETQGWSHFDEWRKSQGLIGEKPELSVQRDALGRLLPGAANLNPAGRPVGADGFKTIFEKALKQVAALNKIDPDDLYAQIIAKGIAQARSGDYRFYKDLLDRLHGKSKDTSAIDLTTGGMPIQGGNQITFVKFSNEDKE